MADAATIRKLLEHMSEIIIANKERLCEIDATIGDGDHGIGMEQSFARAWDKVTAKPDADIAGDLKAFGMGILGGGGGASGALFSSLYLEGAKVMAGKDEMTPADLAAWWRAGLEAIKARGKAQPGDKTMVDALEPAVLAMEKHAKDGFSIQLAKARDAAEEGVEATKSMVAGQGRSRYAGERSLGHQDAGATSVALLVATLSAVVKE